MRSTISTLATVAAGLLASTVSAQGKVAIYWGQGAYQKELSVVCKDPSIDIVNIAFVNGFPKDRNTYPDTNFGNACGGAYYKNPDGSTSKLLASCGIITDGITECHKNGKKVLLSLGGGYPTDYYIASDDAAKWLAEVLVGSFGPQTSDNWPRPFGASAVDGFDLDIESSTAVGAQKYQYYAELVNYIKKLSPGMLISSAPQCVVPDAHLDDAITRAPFDYIFTQFYNTDECSAKRGWNERNQKETGFTFDKWTARLQEKSYNKNVKLFLGLPAGTNGANPNHYLLPEQANDLVTKYQKTALWGGVMLWEATVSQNNTVYGQGYSSWIKYSIEGTFKQNYKPVVSSTIRSSSTLVSSTRSSTPVVSKTSTPVSSKTSTPVSSKTSTPVSSKTSTLVSKTSTPVSSKTSSVVPSKSSTPIVSSSSSVPHSSKSSSVVLSSSVKPSSTSAAPSKTPASSSASSSAYIPSSSSVPVDVSSSVEYPTSSSSIVPSETSSIKYTDYFSTAIPTDYSSSSASVEPSTVYGEDVSSTAIHSSSSADVTSSASSYYESSSTPAITSSASDYYPDISSSTPPSVSESSDYSVYPVSSSTANYDVSSSTTLVDASSTPCTTSTELYPESSKTPDASSSTSEYPSYSESSKVPEASSSAASSSIEYSTESAKTPEASASYSASLSTPADASSTPCTTSTELYPASSKTPEVSSATEYSYYSESSKIPEVSSKSSEYPLEYSTSYEIVSTKTPEASSSESSSVPAVSSKTSEYPVVSTKTAEPSEYGFYSTATPTVTKPAESTTTVVTTTYLDTCSTGLTTKTTVITKTVCNACTKPSDKPEADYPSDWTTSVYVSKTLTVTITKPIHPATDVPAYPTIVSEYPTAPKPSAPAAEYPVDKEEVPTYETPAKSSSVPYEATKPSPKPEVPSYPEVPSAEKPSAPAAEYPVASSKPSYPEDATVTLSQYITLTKVATPVANTPVAYATPVVHQGYPVGNGTVPSGTGAVKPSATGTGKPVKPSSYTPPEFEGAASKLGMGMTGVVAVVAFLML